MSVQELTVGLAHAFGLPGAATQGALVIKRDGRQRYFALATLAEP